MKRISVGELAEVSLALQPRDAGESRLIVVKRYMKMLEDPQAALERFNRERRYAGAVRHRNVAEMLDAYSDHEEAYLAFEYVRGVDLWRLLRWLKGTGNALPPTIIILILGDLLEGLAAIHEAREDNRELGLVHHDLSPSNVLLSIHGDVKLIDFSSAWSTRLAAQGKPEVRSTKLAYVSPEVIAGALVTQRSDLFSFGALAAELLLMRPLFGTGSDLSILLAIRDGHVDALRELSEAELGNDLAHVRDLVLRALQQEASNRFDSARSLLQCMKHLAPAEPAAHRRELAVLVRKAFEEHEPAVHADLRHTLRPPGSELQPAAFADEEGPSTSKLPAISFQLQDAQGKPLGSRTYAQIVEGIATGEASASTRVSMDGEHYVSLNMVPDLARHLPTSSSGQLATAAREETHTLAEMPPSVVIARAAVKGETILAVFQAGEVRKDVYVRGGAPHSVTSNLASELLGEYLVSQHLLSRGELEMALAVLPRFDGRLGETLVGLGLLEPLTLFTHIELQVRQRLTELFRWTSGKVTLYYDIAPPENAFPLRLNPWPLLIEGHGLAAERARAQRSAHTNFIRRNASAPAIPLPEDVAKLLKRITNTPWVELEAHYRGSEAWLEGALAALTDAEYIAEVG